MKKPGIDMLKWTNGFVIFICGVWNISKLLDMFNNQQRANNIDKIHAICLFPTMYIQHGNSTFGIFAGHTFQVPDSINKHLF